MNELNKIIGMRDTTNEYREKFIELCESEQVIPEVEQIKKGYNNVLLLSSILRSRAESLLLLLN